MNQRENPGVSSLAGVGKLPVVHPQIEKSKPPNPDISHQGIARSPEFQNDQYPH